jgi:hypothetical protein
LTPCGRVRDLRRQLIASIMDGREPAFATLDDTARERVAQTLAVWLDRAARKLEAEFPAKRTDHYGRTWSLDE